MKKRFHISHPVAKLVVIVIMLAVLIVWYYSGFTCPFLKLTGLPCGGCGMTRAYISLLKFDIIGAFSYHRMFWACPVMLIYLLFDAPVFGKKADNIILFGIIAGFIINWIINIINCI